MSQRSDNRIWLRTLPPDMHKLNAHPTKAANEPADGSPLSVSVVLCCHNSATRLPETLRHLAGQQVPSELVWEILLIDNASTDDTVALAGQFAAQHRNLAVRLVAEPKLGTAYARQRGIAEARHEAVLFVDDDNWLAPDYVAVVAETLKKHPEIDALGGMSTACFEGIEPDWLSRYQGWYAITGRSKNPVLLTEESFLWTAGAAFRHQALRRALSLGLPCLVSGRRGGSLAAGEDHELCYLLRIAGGSLYRHSGLHFRHYLPKSRLTWEYLKRLHHGDGAVSVELDAYRLAIKRSIWPKWILHSWCAQLINVCFKILLCRFILRCAPSDALEGDERALQFELYRGRLEALWSHRGTYQQMIKRSVVLSDRAMTTQTSCTTGHS